MKKKLTSIVAFIMAVMMSVACLSGCRLLTTNNDKDMDQIVATIKVDDKQENIYKRDLVMQYLNYGYLYVQSYGYTLEQTYELIYDGLISSRITAQGAMQFFESEAGGVLDNTKEKNTLERYLDKEAIVDATYATRVSMNELLESAMEAEEEKYQDSKFVEVRAIPTNATNKTVELTLEEKEKYNGEAFDISSSADRRDAYNEIVDTLKANSLLTNNEFKFDGTLESTVYYKSTYNSNLESQLLTRLEKERSLEVRKGLTFEQLEAEYEEAYENQTKWSNAQFVEGLTNASVGSPMLYSSFGSYGYVYNLLLGVTSEQETAIADIKNDNPNISKADYALKRAEILEATIVKDLRGGWVLTGYDAEERGSELIFTGDYTFAKDKANSLAFQGKVNKIEEADEEEKTPAKYTVADTTVYGLNDFIAFMDGYLGGISQDVISEYSSLGDSVIKAQTLSGVSEYKAKINELLFAFSTDSGSLNTFQGYVIKPAVDGANTEEYVETFGEAGRILLEQGEGYVIVASDFGYHVMFYSEKYSVDYTSGLDNLVAYLNKESGENKTREQWIEYYDDKLENWEDFVEENNYLYNTVNTLTANKVSNEILAIQRNLINANRYDVSDKVILYKDRFADLW